jgi:FlaA1/EpsC-like NDP-sugar epimerase
MKYLKAVVQFCLKFVIGSDWRIAAIVVTNLLMVWALAMVHFDAWFIFPVSLSLSLGLTLGDGLIGKKHTYANWLVVWVPMVFLGVTLMIDLYLHFLLRYAAPKLSAVIIYNVVLIAVVEVVLLYHDRRKGKRRPGKNYALNAFFTLIGLIFLLQFAFPADLSLLRASYKPAPPSPRIIYDPDGL